jgi:predicted nucleic acid-binding Zn ribbon protein
MSAESNRREARRLGEILPQLMARRGYARVISDQIYVDAWQQASGIYARSSRPARMRRGVLEIVVNSSTFVQELTFKKRQLIAELTRLLPEQNIRDLKFIVGSLGDGSDPPARTR